MATTWRLIAPISASGASQMAIDEWLLEQHRLGQSPPCLRFYTWQPIAISLGYHQRHYPPHWHNLQWHGQPIDLVRRPSGGRAVLHQGDLTYSLIISGQQGRRRDIYAHLCKFLVEGWYSLGITLQLGADKNSYRQASNCFDTATTADLVLDNGYKVIGSAQLYRDGCVLQHGSMRLAPDPDLVEKVFGIPSASPDVLMNIQPCQAIAALTAAAQRTFDIRFIIQPLSQEEQQQATAWSQAPRAL